jgi:hypothetical protein
VSSVFVRYEALGRSTREGTSPGKSEIAVGFEKITTGDAEDAEDF